MDMSSLWSFTGTTAEPQQQSKAPSTPSASASNKGKVGSLMKRKDFLGVDQDAESHPNRFYFYKKVFDVEEIIESSTNKLNVNSNDIQSLYLRGVAYYKKNFYQGAIDDLNALLRHDNNHIEALYTRGMAYTKISQQDHAISDFTKVLDIDPDHVSAAFARAACYNSIGHFSKAIEDYNMALMKDNLSPSKGGMTSPDRERRSSFSQSDSLSPSRALSGKTGPSKLSPSTSGHDINIDGFSRNNVFALENVDTMNIPLQIPLASTPKNAKNVIDVKSKLATKTMIEDVVNERAEHHHNLGYQLRRSNDFRGAILEYTNALNIQPNYFKALFNRGFAYDKVGEYLLAIADYTQAIGLQQSNAYSYYNRGITYDKLNLLDNAYGDFTVAISLMNTNPDFYHNRAFCLRKMSRIDEALKDYTSSLEIAPKNFKALYNRGYCYEQVAKYSESIADYSAALQIQPTHFNTLYNRGNVHDVVGNFDSAIADFSSALSLGAAAASTLLARAKVYIKKVDYSNAIDDLNEAIIEVTQSKDSADNSALHELLYYRGACFKGLDKHNDAIVDFTRAINDYNSAVSGAAADKQILANYYSNRGYCWRKLEKYLEAIKDYTDSIALTSEGKTLVKLYNNRAYCCSLIGRTEETLRDYNKVIELDPSNSHAYHNRGICLDKLGKVQEALSDFNKVLAIDSTATVVGTKPSSKADAASDGSTRRVQLPEANTLVTPAKSSRPPQQRVPSSPATSGKVAVQGRPPVRTSTDFVKNLVKTHSLYEQNMNSSPNPTSPFALYSAAKSKSGSPLEKPGSSRASDASSVSSSSKPTILPASNFLSAIQKSRS